MCYRIVRLLSVVLCSLQIGTVLSAPLQMFLQPSPQQMLMLHQIQALQRLQSVPTALDLNWPPQSMPLIILPLPDVLSSSSSDNTNHKIIKKKHENPTFDHELETFLDKHKSQSTQEYNDDDESVIINAEPSHHQKNYDESEVIETYNQRALILLPNGRYIIGGIISAIPFLPFEVNVPDSISWAWNGISSIISGIGQRLPFRPKPQETVTTPQEETMKLILKRFPPTQTAMEPVHPNFGPVIVIPLGIGPMVQPMY